MTGKLREFLTEVTGAEVTTESQEMAYYHCCVKENPTDSWNIAYHLTVDVENPRAIDLIRDVRDAAIKTGKVFIIVKEVCKSKSLEVNPDWFNPDTKDLALLQ